MTKQKTVVKVNRGLDPAEIYYLVGILDQLQPAMIAYVAKNRAGAPNITSKQEAVWKKFRREITKIQKILGGAAVVK